MRFAWKVFLGAILVIAVSTLMVERLVHQKLRDVRLGQVDQQLLVDVDSLARILLEPMRRGDLAELEQLASELAGVRGDRRVTLLDAEAWVIADSHGVPAEMENHSARPEVQQPGTVHERRSASVDLNLRYAARAVREADGRLLGYVRSSLLADPVRHELAALRTATRTGALLSLLVGLVLSLLLARRITVPIAKINQMLSALGRGEYGERVQIDGVDEIGRLAQAVNAMADQLEIRQRLIDEEVSEKEVILSAMEQGLLAVDDEQRVVLANSAARRLLAGATGDPVGRKLAEVSAIPELHAAASLAIGRDERVETEFTLQHPTEGKQIIGLWTTPSSDLAGGKRIAVMVLRDLTEIRRLEKVRTDFVANVSHELKTPLTSMRGYVEAVLEDPAMPDELRSRFLEKAFANTARLTSIVSDLLSLARLEAHEQPNQLEQFELGELVAECVLRAASDAETRGIRVRMEPASEPLSIIGDRTALGSAIDNLLSNAVNFSPEGAPVIVSVFAEGKNRLIEVRDEGPGIARAEQERIFERFYRIDKDRSRALGGTGLGLSIVRNVMRAHGGDVAVRSELGQGSVFRLRLPAA